MEGEMLVTTYNYGYIICRTFIIIKQDALPYFSQQHLYTIVDMSVFRQQIVVGV